MNWETLYSSKRIQSSTKVSLGKGRGEYIRDYDRVIFSSPFRKLQSKTQVFPLPGHFFVHNRLTHSLEVASVGRSLGRLAGEKLAASQTLSADAAEFYRFELSDVIQTACLAHDIGNPPFGHFGEDAIRSFFRGFFQTYGDLGLSPVQMRDFTYFEGNANAFRILTSLFVSSGLKLTYTTLASVVKYPVDSLYGFEKGDLPRKKSGYMDSEKKYFAEMVEVLGIPARSQGYARHPYVYLVEAADDICYRIIDLEDAYKLKVVSFQEVIDLLRPLLNGTEMENYLDGKLRQLQDEEQKISLLRALLINHFTQSCADIFIREEAALLEGRLNTALMDMIEGPVQEHLEALNAFSVARIYNHSSVIEKELSGHRVINGLLEDFCNALVDTKKEKSKKVLRLIPGAFTGQYYEDLQHIVDYISQMTDDFAVDLYKKIRGIN